MYQISIYIGIILLLWGISGFVFSAISYVVERRNMFELSIVNIVFCILFGPLFISHLLAHFRGLIIIALLFFLYLCIYYPLKHKVMRKGLLAMCLGVGMIFVGTAFSH